MSYILDALRRAEAERERERHAVPRLTSPVWLPHAPAAAPARRGWLYASVGVAVGTAAALAAWVWWPETKPSLAEAPARPAPPPAASELPPPGVAAAPVPPLPPRAVAAAPAPLLPPRAVAAAPAPLPATRQPPAVAAAPRPVAPPATIAPVPPPAPPRPLTVAELPEPQRSAVQRLVFSGAVHSEDRRQSFAMLGGQIVREGETLAEGIVLERILPRTALLRAGERLVEVPF